MMLTHCGNNVRNRYSGCVSSVKDIVPVPLKTSRNLNSTFDVECSVFDVHNPARQKQREMTGQKTSTILPLVSRLPIPYPNPRHGPYSEL